VDVPERTVSGPPGSTQLARLAAGVERAKRSKRLQLAVLVAILAAALGFRLNMARSGLPYVHNGDEPRLASGALEMLKAGSYSPPDFHYGSVTIYLNLAVDLLQYARLRCSPKDAPEHLESPDEIRTGVETGWRWDISHPSFFLANRALAALLGTAAVFLTFLLGRMYVGPWAGIAAASVVAGLEFHIFQSSMVTADIPSSVVSLCAVALSIQFLREDRPGHLALALLLGGLAGSTKYNQAVAVVAPMTAFVASLVTRGSRPWLWFAVFVLPLAGFLLGSPYALIEVPKYLYYAGWEAYHYKASGQVRFTVEAGWPHVALQMGRIAQNVGPFVILPALLGVLALARQKLGFALLAFPIGYTWFFCSMRLDFHRNFVVIYPFVAVAFAAGLASAWHWTQRAWQGRARDGATVALAAALALGVGIHFARAAASSRHLPESRTAAMQLAADLARERQWKSIAVAAELRIHPLDLARLPVPATVLPLRDLLNRREQFDAIVTPVRLYETTARSEKVHERMRALNRALPRDGIVGEILGECTNPAHPSINPAIHILARPGEPATPVRRLASAGDTLSRSVHETEELDF
jgi:dolichyl-phosphate-mannose-protein mannosyltransferase